MRTWFATITLDDWNYRGIKVYYISFCKEAQHSVMLILGGHAAVQENVRVPIWMTEAFCSSPLRPAPGVINGHSGCWERYLRYNVNPNTGSGWVAASEALMEKMEKPVKVPVRAEMEKLMGRFMIVEG